MVYKYAQMLGLVLDRYKGIAIAGTHGKSTTRGWLVFVLKKLGIEPNFVIGADILQFGSSSGIGSSDIFVAEACEYDRSFLNLHPKIGAILNIEPDHLDYYSGIDEIVQAFADFASNISQRWGSCCRCAGCKCRKNPGANERQKGNSDLWRCRWFGHFGSKYQIYAGLYAI